MADPNFSPGDVTIDEFILSGSAGGGDITRRLIEFKIFENIKNPYNILTAEVIDVSDVLNTFPGLNGTETISLSFRNIGDPTPYTGLFAITEVNKVNSAENQRVQLYSITGYSPHMNRLPIVTKSYKNMTGTDVAGDLVNSFLSPLKPLAIQDGGRGIIGNDVHPYIINGIQIFKAIKQTLSRTQSASNDSSAWYFFENQHNMIIDTMEHLLSGGTSVASYYERPLGSNFLVDQALQPFIIMDIEEHSRVNTTEQLQGVNQTVQSFDSFARKYATKNIMAAAFSGLGSSPLGAGLKSAASTTRNFLPKNGAGPKTGLEDVIAPRKSMAGIVDSQSAKVHVLFNQNLTVGWYASVFPLAPAGDTDTPVLSRISGPLLITELVHTVKTRQEKPMATTTWKGNKGGFD